ncbi:motor neuron and pancreas homeobox protein 1-like [Anopheles darlingi]|uniref:motor neuron and pancreas homeobox protein 1-like n=1 Tax=Anopheles darlingi TaxID=43151 RepID=UPI0020FFF64D|nr:motor neuron and pancreas homeobox protein 1-like [Anopheles darlingi]
MKQCKQCNHSGTEHDHTKHGCQGRRSSLQHRPSVSITASNTTATTTTSTTSTTSSTMKTVPGNTATTATKSSTTTSSSSSSSRDGKETEMKLDVRAASELKPAKGQPPYHHHHYPYGHHHHPLVTAAAAAAAAAGAGKLVPGGKLVGPGVDSFSALQLLPPHLRDVVLAAHLLRGKHHARVLSSSSTRCGGNHHRAPVCGRWPIALRHRPQDASLDATQQINFINSTTTTTVRFFFVD